MKKENITKKFTTDECISDQCYIDFLKILKTIFYFRTLSTDAIKILIGDFEYRSQTINRTYNDVFKLLGVCSDLCIGNNIYDEYHRLVFHKVHECVREHFETIKKEFENS